MPHSLAELDESLRETLTRIASGLVSDGAQAVVLTGSHARGRARPDSDVDLFVVGDGPRERFVPFDGRLFSLHWWTPEEARRRMVQPESAVVAVAAWRNAVVLEDPLGVAAELRREAHGWSWDRIAHEADAFVCEQLVGWAEYVVKLVVAVENGRDLDACAFRSETAVKLGPLLAIRKRVEADSENGLWESIADVGGPEWRSAVERALVTGGQSLEESVTGAVELFTLLARDVEPLLDERQRAVVGRALDRAERYVARSTS